MKARIHFDGGCEPNPGSKYGSYAVELDDIFEISSKRFALGHGTNNEAEFESLIEALNALFNAAIKSNTDPKTIRVELFTDSTIVRNWLQKFHGFKPEKVRNERRLAMGALAGKCIALLLPFHSFTVQWNPRQINVNKFGH